MTSGTVSSIFLFLLSVVPVLAQQQVQYNQVLNVNGDVSLLHLPSNRVVLITLVDGPQLVCVP